MDKNLLVAKDVVKIQRFNEDLHDVHANTRKDLTPTSPGFIEVLRFVTL